MPLMKSGSAKAFSHNIKAEMKAGKPQKQAIAIAYATKRRAGKKAHGGEVKYSDKAIHKEMAEEAIEKLERARLGGQHAKEGQGRIMSPAKLAYGGEAYQKGVASMYPDRLAHGGDVHEEQAKKRAKMLQLTGKGMQFKDDPNEFPPKMAYGGEAYSEAEEDDEDLEYIYDMKVPGGHHEEEEHGENIHDLKLAKGGKVDMTNMKLHPHHVPDEERAQSLVDRIMKRRANAMDLGAEEIAYDEGGMVEEEAKEDDLENKFVHDSPEEEAHDGNLHPFEHEHKAKRKAMIRRMAYGY